MTRDLHSNKAWKDTKSYTILNRFHILASTAVIALKLLLCFNAICRLLTLVPELFHAQSAANALCFLIISIVTCVHHIKMRKIRSLFNVLSAIKIIIREKLSLITVLSTHLTVKFVQCVNSAAKVSRKLLCTWTCTLNLTCTFAIIVRVSI